MCGSDLLQSSLYIVNINYNHLPTEKTTNMKVTDTEFILLHARNKVAGSECNN